jgi:mRNA interferase HigB
MRIINEPAIAKFARKHPDSRRWLEGWLLVVREVEWQSIRDVKLAYPATDGGVKVASGARVTVFDVCGNKYRMIADVNYGIQTVNVLELLTHAEYSSNRWKGRY